ncbi:MAG: hypothetical protein B7Y31_08705, partial [Novosphingobium sp. 16-62-11]
MAKYKALSLLLATSAAALLATPALADDLRQALTSAYNTNPTLQAARATQRATDEGVPIARARALPSLSGQGSYNRTLKANPNSFLITDWSTSVDLSLQVPIYSGGSVKNSIRAAKTRVEAGQEDLRGTEAGVFSEVVAAYMDVIRDGAIVGLNRNNVEVLSVNLSATTDRFDIGDVTRTDVAQSNSRLALARSDLRTAEANLQSSRERYIQVVGKPPVDLAPPPPLPGLPETPDDAVVFALENNPDLLAARERSKAAAFDVKVADAAKKPTISASANGSRQEFKGSFLGTNEVLQQANTTAQAGVTVSVPLFQGGGPAAQTRQAQARETA